MHFKRFFREDKKHFHGHEKVLFLQSRFIISDIKQTSRARYKTDGDFTSKQQ